MSRVLILAALLAICAPAAAQTFPMGPDLQYPLQTGTQDHAGYANEAAGMAAVGFTMAYGIGNRPMFKSFGVDHGELAALKANNLALVAGNLNIDVTGNTSNTSVASFLALAAADSYLNGILGYIVEDEPNCNGAGGGSGINLTEMVPGQVALVNSYDPTRPAFVNQTAWPKNTALAGRYADNPANVPTTHTCYQSDVAELQASYDISFDQYMVSPYGQGVLTHSPPWSFQTGPDLVNFTHAADTLWEGAAVAKATRDLAKPGQPFWQWVEGRGDTLVSLTFGACSDNNVCPKGNEYRITEPQFISEWWMALIEGAQGIEVFCDDTEGHAFCCGGSKGEPRRPGRPPPPAAASVTYMTGVTAAW